MDGLAVAFQNESNIRVNKEALIETCSLILRRLNRVGRVEIELVVTGDTKIKKLNKQYRQQNKPTDVLSFPPSRDSSDNGEFLGSIVISAKTAAKQAKQAGIKTEDELRVLTGHGLLHLLGYHHR